MYENVAFNRTISIIGNTITNKNLSYKSSQGVAFTRKGGAFTRKGGAFTRKGGAFTRKGGAFTRKGGASTTLTLYKYILQLGL